MKYSYVFDVWIEVREIPWYSRLFDPCIGKDRFIDRSKFFFFVLFGLYYSYLTIFLIIFYNFHMEFEFFSGFSFSFEVWKRKCGNLIRFYYPVVFCLILFYFILPDLNFILDVWSKFTIQREHLFIISSEQWNFQLSYHSCDPLILHQHFSMIPQIPISVSIICITVPETNCILYCINLAILRGNSKDYFWKVHT